MLECPFLLGTPLHNLPSVWLVAGAASGQARPLWLPSILKRTPLRSHPRAVALGLVVLELRILMLTSIESLPRALAGHSLPLALFAGQCFSVHSREEALRHRRVKSFVQGCPTRRRQSPVSGKTRALSVMSPQRWDFLLHYLLEGLQSSPPGPPL